MGFKPEANPFYLQFRTLDWHKPPRPIIRAKLATKIAKSVERFVKAKEDTQVDADFAEWRIGTGYVNLDRLTLISFKQASRSSWQPVLALRY